jgi:hypothetical protein
MNVERDRRTGIRKRRDERRRSRISLSVLAGLAVAIVCVPTTTLVAQAAAGPSVQALCGPVGPGYARCLGLQLVSSPGAQPFTASAPAGFSPADLQSAYNLPSSAAGSGQTVAIVDAYDDPNAGSDLATYRAQFGLAPCTQASGCFRKVNQTGGLSYPSPDANWAGEISLDLDMASAICPKCHILLVEANSESIIDLGTAVNEAAALGANAISNSYGGPESSGDATFDHYFTHPGIAITAASGDSGYGVEYPAASPDVTAVGGTSLSRAANSRGWNETVWNDIAGAPGSGCSASEARPAWQTSNPNIVGTGCTGRADTDVSAVADPSTGVAAYDSYLAAGWGEFGGTSAASPIIASVDALAGNAAATGPGYPYSHTAGLNDVTTGSNGSCAGSALCTAGIGWDGPTGLGTPNGISAFGGGPPSVSAVTPAAGPVGGGATVTVTGRGFQAGMTATIGGVAVTPSAVSFTSFKFTTPAAPAGMVQVQVTTVGVTSALTSADDYTYGDPPVISSVAPAKGLVSGGQTVIVTGSGFTAAMTATIGGHAVTPSGVSATSFTFVTPAGAAGVVQVQVTTVVSASALTAADDYTYEGLPVISAVTPSAGPVIGGQVVTVTGSGFVAGMTVTIGGTAVTPSGITASSFSFTTPAETAGYDQVQVTNLAGSSALTPAAGYIYSGLGSFIPVTPFRILDTRSGLCGIHTCGALGAGQTLGLQITGYTDARTSGSVPAGATAVVLNLVAVNASASSLLTVSPSGTGRPLAANLNFSAHVNTATLVTVALGQNGGSDSQREVNIFNALGIVNVVGDVEGYFVPQAASNPAGEFHAIAPLRVCDTRAKQPANGCNLGHSTDNRLGSGQVMRVNVSGVPSGVGGSPASIPTDGSAGAAVLNLAAVAGTQATWLTVFPTQTNGTCATSQPGTATINVSAGGVQDNRVMVPLGPSHSGGPSTDVCVYNAAGTINVVLDAGGWFGSTTGSPPTGAQYQAIGPTRICDTRSGTGTLCSGHQLTSGGTLLVAVAGVDGIPGSGPVAIIATLTAVSGSQLTYLIVYPADVSPRPNASDVNLNPGRALPNLVVVGLASGAHSGDLNLFNAAGSINAVLDVDGWFQ